MPNELTPIDLVDLAKGDYQTAEWSIPFSSAAITFEMRTSDWSQTISKAGFQYTRAAEWYAECALVGTFLLLEYVVVDPEIRGGRPVLKGTGFTISQTLVELADSSGVAEVAENFNLDRETIQGFLRGLSLLYERSFRP